MSNFSRAKRVLEDFERRRARLLQEIATGETARVSLAGLDTELAGARQHFQHEQSKVDAEMFVSLERELDGVLEKLDSTGWTPTGECRAVEIIAEFRFHGRSGQSAEMLRLYIERLRKPITHSDKRLRWRGLLSWIHPKAEVAA